MAHFKCMAATQSVSPNRIHLYMLFDGVFHDLVVHHQLLLLLRVDSGLLFRGWICSTGKHSLFHHVLSAELLLPRLVVFLSPFFPPVFIFPHIIYSLFRRDSWLLACCARTSVSKVSKVKYSSPFAWESDSDCSRNSAKKSGRQQPNTKK